MCMFKLINKPYSVIFVAIAFFGRGIQGLATGFLQTAGIIIPIDYANSIF